MDVKRERLIRAMNPPGKRAWSPESQDLNLLLHDLANTMPAGWSLGYEMADDTPFPDGGSNLDVFDAEHKRAWRERLRRRRDDDDDAADDLAAIPAEGTHHVLLELVHEETGATILRWVDREDLARIVRQPGRTPAQRLTAARAHVSAAITDGEARVARKRQRLEAGGVGRRER